MHRIPVTGGMESTYEGIPILTRDLAEDDLALLAAGFVAAEIGEFTRYELSVAADGGWPVSADIERSVDVGTALSLFGIPATEVLHPDAPATVTDRLRLSRINDGTIRVDLPLLAG